MRDEFLGGISLALRRWRSAFAVAFVFTVVSVVTAIILGDVLGQWAVLRGGTSLRQQRAVVFTAYYPQNGVSAISKGTLQALEAHVSEGAAYTSVTNNATVDDPNRASGYQVIVLVGKRTSDLFPDLGLCTPAPCASVGARVTQSLSRIDLPGLSITVTNRLTRGATWFDPNAAGLPLDRSVVVNLPYQQLGLLNEFAREEAVARAVLLGPDGATVDSLVSAAARDGLYLVPEELAVEQPRKFRDLMVTASMYLVALACFLALMLYAFVSMSLAVVRDELRGIVIRRMSGATPAGATVRIASFLGAVMLVVPTGICGALILIGPPVQQGAFLALGVLWTCWLAVLLLARRRFLAERLLVS